MRISRGRILALTVLASCGPTSTGPGGTDVKRPDGVARPCPAADAAWLVNWQADDRADDGTVRHPEGWRVVLRMEGVDEETVDNDSYKTLASAAELGALTTPPPEVLWVYGLGERPCRATVGSYLQEVNADYIAYQTWSALLEGCPAWKSGQAATTWALASAEEPTGCQLHEARTAAVRDLDWEEERGPTLPKGAGTPLPPEVAAVMPAHECAAPSCEPLWHAWSTPAALKPAAYQVVAGWLKVPELEPEEGGDPEDADEEGDDDEYDEAADMCTWEMEYHFGIYLTGADGTLHAYEEPKAEPSEDDDEEWDGMDALLLRGVFADADGAKILLMGSLGTYAAYPLAADGTTKPAARREWYLPYPEDYESPSVGPDCGL